MKLKERIMRVLYGKKPDKIPWLIIDGLLHRGYLERLLRNLGMGLMVPVPVYKEEIHNITIKEEKNHDNIRITYHTPLGDAYALIRASLSLGTGSSWIVKHLLERREDYDVVKYIIENTEYVPNYENFSLTERFLGDDGIVMAIAPPSPLMRLFKEIMGQRIFAIEVYRQSDDFKELFDILWRKHQEAYEIVAESPAKVVWCIENMDGIFIGPKLFKKYCIPAYNKYAEILHSKGKLMSIHMDGRLRCLKELIPQINVDCIDGFTPPPIGDLPIREARGIWGDKFAIWINIPESIFYYEPKKIKEYLINLIGEVKGGRFIVGITEDIPTERFEIACRILGEVMKENIRC